MLNFIATLYFIKSENKELWLKRKKIATYLACKMEKFSITLFTKLTN